MEWFKESSYQKESSLWDWFKDLFQKKVSKDEIIKDIQAKFGISYSEAVELFNFAEERKRFYGFAQRGEIVKGKVRITVQKQLRSLRDGLTDLAKCIEIKASEIPEYKESNPEKAKILQQQVDMLKEARDIYQKAILVLEDYLKLKTGGL